MKVRWLWRAYDDLRQVYEFITQDDSRAAAREVERVLDAVGMLGRMTGVGRPGRVPGTRELIVSSYIVAYRVKKDRVEILRILHQARKWPETLG